jgi:dienelactone hydrolase
MRILLDLAVAFMGIGLVEAVIKQIAKRWAQRRILAAAPAVLELLDRQMPDLLKQFNGQQIEHIVRHKLETITGESWAQQSIEPIFRLYDPRITADRQQP